MRIVLDTNVIIAGLKSKRGASFKVLSLIGIGKFDLVLSVPLLFEYEAVLKRLKPPQLSDSDIDDILDYFCSVATQCKIFYLWRPILKDPTDDMVLELAVESGSDFIVTFNLSDFVGSNRFGIGAITPMTFLAKIGELA